MTGKLVDRLVAAGVFLYAFVVYAITMAETAPFWDSGEFISSVRWLEVMHPPGAPFYVLLGRFFTLFAPVFGGMTTEPVAFSVNLLSVAASALTILLTHLTIVRLVRVWKGRPDAWSPVDRLAANVGGVVGALAFAASDSFWFNAVEAEVYALSMTFTAAVVWLALVWREETLEEEADMRARGEHPFGLKADRYLLIIAYLFGLAIGVHLLNLLALFFVALVVFFTKFDRAEWTAGQRFGRLVLAGLASAVAFFVVYPGVIQWLPSLARKTGAPTVVLVGVIAALTAAVWWTQRARRPVANLAALAITLVVIGYSTYGVIFLRADADPPINLNDPNTADRFVSYLEREQYGQTPLLRGPNLGTNFQREVSLPRRWSPDPSHVEVYRHYNSDLGFFFQYQIGYMYWRYFLWNFAGRAGDYEGSPWVTGIADHPDEAQWSALSPSERESRNVYFGLPLLLGLVGMAFHFMRDWRQAFAVALLFFITGLGIVLYLNQTPLQPRERDYSYVASFFAFTLWIGLGATGLIELISEALGERGKGLSVQRTAGIAVAGLTFLAVPVLMLAQGYNDHDRSGVRLPTDFATNMLESTAPNAILFTNGDNDTYPLWYVQEVLGIRRDVRVVNLSLLQTDWYIRQLKNTWSRESAPLPMSWTDDDINNMEPTAWEPQTVSLPTPSGTPIEWRLDGQPYGDMHVLFTNDQAIINIMAENARRGWERPIYFASTVARSSELGLSPFFQNEGLARRVMPEVSGSTDPDGRIMPDIVAQRLSKFQFRNLADPHVQYDDNARGLADVYRRTYATIATGLAAQGQKDEALALLNQLQEEVSTEVIPPSFASRIVIGGAFAAAGDQAAATRILGAAEEEVLARLQSSGTQGDMEESVQYVWFIMRAYAEAGAFEAAAAFSGRVAETAGEPNFRMTTEQIRTQFLPMINGSAPTGDSAAPADAVPDVAQDSGQG